jgi:hypothetical protein
VAVWREVAQMQHQRILVAQTDPMGDAALLALGLAIGQHGGRLGDLAERHAGPEKLDIRLHLRMRGSIQPALVVARAAVPGEPAPRNVGRIAVRPDQVGIEGNHVAVLDHPGARLLIPGVGPRA